MDDAELRRLRVLVTPAAWAAHQALPEAEQISLPDALEIHGDLRLVAADVLETVCLKAREQNVASTGGLKRLKIEGELEVEYAAGGGASADAWCERAAALHAQVQTSRSGVPSPAFTEWA